MDGWDTQDSEEIVVRRRMRVGRRRPTRGPVIRIALTVMVVVLIGLGAGAYFWYNQPGGLESLPNPAVVAPGGFRASIGDRNTITVGLEVRSVADEPITLTDARILTPTGMTLVTLSILPPGDGNSGFTLEGDLPAMAPVTLGTTAADRNAIVAARFTVTCADLPQPEDATGEQIFVTISFAGQSRVEELTPPVLDSDVPWLTSSARRICADPLPVGSPEPPLPALPGGTAPPTP